MAPSPTALDMTVDLTSGPAREVKKRFADPRRKLVQITLREGEVLAKHHAIHPITIHCVAGRGVLRIDDTEVSTVSMAPGVVVCLDERVRHELEATPAVSVLISFFRPESS